MVYVFPLEVWPISEDGAVETLEEARDERGRSGSEYRVLCRFLRVHLIECEGLALG